MTSKRPSSVKMVSFEKPQGVQVSQGLENGSENCITSVADATYPYQIRPAPRKVAIVVMGLTGAGKSTFISQLTRENVDIGHSLESCTTTTMGYEVNRNDGQTIYAIDTVGFDDTNADNSKVLRQISTFLCSICDGSGLHLGGIIYVHRITDTRMSGSSLKCLRIFEKICGEQCFEDVTIVTTMWGSLQSARARDGAERRERELREKPEYFGHLTKGGARMVRYEDPEGNFLTAMSIVDQLISRERRVLLQLQTEMLSREGFTLAETGAGLFLEVELTKARQKYDEELRDLEDLILELPNEAGLRETVRQQQKDWAEQLRQSEFLHSSLAITREDMKRETLEIANGSYNAEPAMIEDESSEVTRLEELLKQTEIERDMRLKEEKAHRKDIEKKYHRETEDLSKQLGALRRKLEDRKKKQTITKDQAKMFTKISQSFFGMIRTALRPTSTKEQVFESPHRHNSLPPDFKTVKREPMRLQRKSKRSKKGRRDEDSNSKSRAVPTYASTYPLSEDDSEDESEYEYTYVPDETLSNRHTSTTTWPNQSIDISFGGPRRRIDTQPTPNAIAYTSLPSTYSNMQPPPTQSSTYTREVKGPYDQSTWH